MKAEFEMEPEFEMDGAHVEAILERLRRRLIDDYRRTSTKEEALEPRPKRLRNLEEELTALDKVMEVARRMP